MPSSISPLSQPEPENNCADCLYMTLAGIPVQPVEHPDYLEFLQPFHNPQIDLYLTLRFSQQWESLPQGRIQFGLKGGALRLRVEGGEIPYESRIMGSMELVVPTVEMDSQTNRPIRDRTSPEFDMLTFDSQENGATEPQLQKRQTDYHSICHITTKVTEENPAWIFEEERGEPVLNGWLNQVKLGTLNVSALPCHLDATFEVSRRDICLTHVDRLWSPEISRNKQAVLDRLIIQQLLERKCKPYLSRVELHYDG
ncbi:hypothetical protein [Coleofasciculus sp. F4-SAH-05]|uniref:hypothetical protein n=1 Tax=Coleofasciculus sp. F4-SAH-05 TaxID=3069525 RepID=UPI0032F1F381